jgi:hypothetical protein
MVLHLIIQGRCGNLLLVYVLGLLFDSEDGALFPKRRKLYCVMSRTLHRYGCKAKKYFWIKTDKHYGLIITTRS